MQIIKAISKCANIVFTFDLMRKVYRPIDVWKFLFQVYKEIREIVICKMKFAKNLPTTLPDVFFCANWLNFQDIILIWCCFEFSLDVLIDLQCSSMNAQCLLVNNIYLLQFEFSDFVYMPSWSLWHVAVSRISNVCLIPSFFSLI